MFTCHREEICSQPIQGPELQQLVREHNLPSGQGHLTEDPEEDLVASPVTRHLLLISCTHDAASQGTEPLGLRRMPIEDQEFLQASMRR